MSVQREILSREEMNRTQGSALWPTLDYLAETNPIIRAWVMAFRHAGYRGMPVSQETMLAEMIAMLDEQAGTLEAMVLRQLNHASPPILLPPTDHAARVAELEAEVARLRAAAARLVESWQFVRDDWASQVAAQDTEYHKGYTRGHSQRAGDCALQLHEALAQQSPGVV